jgi:hypothetical protein
MRRLPFRFTVRGMMFVVAVFGVVLGGWLEVSRLIRIATARRRDAASYAASAALARKFARQYSSTASQYSWMAEESLRAAESSGPANSALSEQLKQVASLRVSAAARYDRNADYWAIMNKKYERSARSPWFSVEPDPQPPRD